VEAFNLSNGHSLEVNVSGVAKYGCEKELLFFIGEQE